MGAPQQAHDISFRRVALATAIITAVSLVYVLLAATLDSGSRPALPSPTVADEVNDLEVARFDEVTAAEKSIAPARERLSSYGWVDRRHALIHIPLDRAIDIYLQRSQGEAP
jgi:hypothetical protein